MSRLSPSKVALAGVLSLALLALAPARPKLPAVLTITPSAHNFGKVPVSGLVQNAFAVSLPVGAGPGLTISASIGGPNPADFSVSTSPTILGQILGSQCNTSWRTGACFYVVEFSPQSLGVKTASLLVADSRGNAGTASLTGTGIARPSLLCRPYLVSCNYADYYSGTYTARTVESAPPGITNIAGRWETTVNISIVKGVATCLVTQNDWEEEYTGSKLDRRSTSQGTISGPGLFAIEFRGIGPSMEYVLHFDCPSVSPTGTWFDYLIGTSGTSRGDPSEPADWRHASIGADPQPATQIGMVNLTGGQTDPSSNPNGVTGSTTILWSLKRW